MITRGHPPHPIVVVADDVVDIRLYFDSEVFSSYLEGKKREPIRLSFPQTISSPDSPPSACPSINSGLWRNRLMERKSLPGPRP
jgi:hypothetical protein